VLEVVHAIALNFSNGFTWPGYAALVVDGSAGSFYPLSGVVTILPTGTA
jgi:multidrug transporter EmrE-like cation transporter